MHKGNVLFGMNSKNHAKYLRIVANVFIFV